MSMFSRLLPFSGAQATPAFHKKKYAAVLRSDLGHDPALDAAETLAAFSPDIIPLGKTAPERADIAAAYGAFIAHPLHVGDANGIWIRARSFGAPGFAAPEVSLVEIENELILWPQAWRGVPAIGETTLSAANGGAADVLVSDNAIELPAKTHEAGRHSTLLALSGASVARTGAPRNWRELSSSVGSNINVSAYNVLSVEPSFEHHELRTRLRVFENERDHVEMRLSIESVGIPNTGLEARFVVLAADKKELFVLERCALGPGATPPGVDVRLPPGFDGTVHVEVFKAPDATVCDHASVSLVATALKSDGLTALLGAEHIVFDSAVTLKLYVQKRKAQWDSTNFYFRGYMGDGAPPRRRAYAFCPDVQPGGQSPDSDPATTYGNFNVDVASQRGNRIYPNASNFVYSRVTSLRAVSGTARLFAVPNTMLLYPTKYHKFSVWDVLYDEGSAHLKEEIAYRGFSCNNAGQLVIPAPFDYFKPAAPGTLAAGSDHYCLVIEGVEGIDPANPNAYCHWPHQDVLAATSAWATWLLNEPRVAYRNTTYSGGSNVGVVSFRTELAPPEIATATDTWYYELELQDVPVGSQIEVVGRVISDNPPDKLPSNLGIPKQTVQETDQVFPSSRFTGVGKDFHLLLTITWYPNGKTVNPNQQLNANAILRNPRTGLLAQTLKAHWNPAPVETELVVFPDYPLFKQSIKGVRVNKAQGYTGLRGVMRAFDQPGTIAANAVAAAEAAPIVEVTVGSDTLVVQ